MDKVVRVSEIELRKDGGFLQNFTSRGDKWKSIPAIVIDAWSQGLICFLHKEKDPFHQRLVDLLLHGPDFWY